MTETSDKSDWLTEAKRLHKQGMPFAAIARAVGQSRQLVHYHLTGAKVARRRDRQTPEQVDKARRQAREWHRKKKRDRNA